ncbi:dihydrodipicolinate synthase family protein [Actinoplanes couchii]|uniref:Dihydrodipicolinate synthase family protein n=1 Tax=Actinoplanes couchii TaxID=403638 RepID=A0ABQ3X7S9_9ACTN|nr:dihydrodipicolinate synthase family protein [Actinoplanes couchii]MDR6320441.1 4-hydroxy-tetrahydrodipicolinate synthase [Actinoplanes couchii]GID54547.1 dihydrodipicolinate synthase family protein [Actinoplanes couchii]
MITGLSAFPLTPIAGDGSVDEKAFIGLVERLVTAGVDWIAPLGSTGSYAYLRPDERARVTRLAVEHAAGIPVMVGIGATRTREVLKLAEDAQTAGASALLLAPVSYQPLTADDVFGLYEDVTREVSVPVVVYDNPGTTHFVFTDELYQAVGRLPRIASIKIPGAASARVGELRELLPAHVTLGVSGDAFGAAGLIAGCDGWYTAVGGTLPTPALTITRAVQAGDHATALTESDRLKPLWDLFARHGGSIRVLATIAEHLALVTAPCLPTPLRGLTDAARTEVIEILERLNLAK